MTLVYYKKAFKKKYPKMPTPIQEAFKERLKLFLENPWHPILRNHSVEKAFPGCRSINLTGDYRAIFKQDDCSIEFINIGSHSQLYD